MWRRFAAVHARRLVDARAERISGAPSSRRTPSRLIVPNQADLQPFLDHLAEIVRLGQQKGEIRMMPVESAIDVIWAVYNQGRRAGVFDAMAPDAVAAFISARLRAVPAA